MRQIVAEDTKKKKERISDLTYSHLCPTLAPAYSLDPTVAYIEPTLLPNSPTTLL